MERKCPHCGCPISANDKFCNKCGHKLPRASDRGSVSETRDDSKRATSVRKKSVDTAPAEYDYDSDAYVPDRGLWQKFFTFKGRLNPARYAFRLFIIVMMLYVVLMIGFYICNKYQLKGAEKWLSGASVLMFILPIPISVRRAHDMGRPGWWAILGVLPIIGAALAFCFDKVHWVDKHGEHHEESNFNPFGAYFAFFYLLLMSFFAMLFFTFTSGIRGTNQYGPDPRGECVPRPFEGNPLLKMISKLEEGSYPALKITGAMVLIFFAVSLLFPATIGFQNRRVNVANRPASNPKVENPAPQSAEQYPAVKDAVKQMLEATPPPIVEKSPQPQVVAQPLTNDNQRAAVQALTNFHEWITNKNFQSAYNCFSRGMQSEISYDGWAPGFDTTVSSNVSEVRVVNESPNAIELNYVLTAVDNINGRESTAQFNGTATVINEGGQWKLDFIKNKVR